MRTVCIGHGVDFVYLEWPIRSRGMSAVGRIATLSVLTAGAAIKLALGGHHPEPRRLVGDRYDGCVRVLTQVA